MQASELWANIPGIAYGGDYNPEQWPRETWDEDMRLMREAGVNFVSIGMWAWAYMEPSEGVFDFGWLDDLLDLLHTNGVRVALGTPTAAPPAWFFARYPHARVTTADGTVLGIGSRGMASPHSPEYHAAIVRIAGELARRYAEHPAVVLWHIHNEYGAPVAEDHSPTAAAAFREWLKERYGTLAELNRAWGTFVWGQHYTDWEHITTPIAAPSVVNPAQKLDFARFTDHALRACFIAEREAIRAHASQPVTTNFMANQHWGVDLWAWADEVDVVSDDHYLVAADRDAHIGLALAADLTRSLAGGKPWLLLEHSTSGVNWQPRNVAKRPGEMARNSLAHFARGADCIGFFQWRAARHGQEKFHSAMLPHAGTGSRIFREVRQLGADLSRLGEVQGATVQADVALLWDFQSLWAQGLEWRPSEDLDYKQQLRHYYERLWRDGLTVDVLHPGADLSGYKLVVAPSLYLLRRTDAERLNAYVAAGGTLLVGCFAAAVDETDAVHEGGYLAPLQPSLGATVEEYLPLREDESTAVAYGEHALRTRVWAEAVILRGAEARANYSDGPAAGQPAITRHRHGDGHGWYISTYATPETLAPVMADVYADAGLTLPDLPEGVELVTRNKGADRYHVVINHTDHPVSLPLTGLNLLTDETATGALDVAAGAVAVIRTS